MKCLVLTTIVFLGVAAADAEELSWECTYSTKAVQVEFNKQGSPDIEVGGSGGMGPIVLTLDTGSGEAHLIANNTVEVFPIISGGTLTFIEKTPTGLSIITLFISAQLDSNERVPFAQARHLDLAGPFPQQYYGICAPIER